MAKKLFLTAGHHNKDSGAVGNGYKESELNIELRDLITQRVKELNASIEVYNDDDDLTLGQVIANVIETATSQDVFVEIHFDASDNASASGTTALVANNAGDKSKALAKELVDLNASILGIKNRGVKSEADSHRGKLGMLHTKAISVLMEIAFISNPKDMELYQEHKHWLADDYARTLIKYLN